MTKILLVEDDKSLQEIYGVRLGSEGYSVLIAGDGEEALGVALKEKPDLILSDVMMPKISGFDMLDILRTTPEIQNTKVIIMTALSSDDQRERGEKLGADLYLVKSQVGIEDVVQAVKNILERPAPQVETPLVSEPTATSAETLPAAPEATPISEPQISTEAAPEPAMADQPEVQANLQTEQVTPPAFSEPIASEMPAWQTLPTSETTAQSATQTEQNTPTNLNPQYRQPVSLRDIIPPRELDK